MAYVIKDGQIVRIVIRDQMSQDALVQVELRTFGYTDGMNAAFVAEILKREL
jgi:hypothetical protein